VSLHGTAAYDGQQDLPASVRRALVAARAAGFEHVCLPGQGRLLMALAAGVGDGAIGETGTGCGVGLAWMAAGAGPSARLVSVECDAARVRAAQEVFAGEPRVTVRQGGWDALHGSGPFDLLFLDGGTRAKAAELPIDPARWLTPGGVVVIDDFTPADSWPPRFEGAVDVDRLAWLEHPALMATEVRVAPHAAAIVATRRHG
jgi:predicted O-methyltransferase YrrM